MNTLNINNSIVQEVLKNFFASQIIYKTDFLVHETISPFSSHKKVSIEELCLVHDFTEEMNSKILYTREIKRRFPIVFKKLADEITSKKWNDHLQKNDNFDLNNIVELFTSKTLKEDLETNFPTIPVYKVPGEKTGPVKTFIILFPYWHNSNGFDFAALEYLQEKGFAGSVVIRMSMGCIGKILYAIIKKYKIDAFINFYDHGESCNNWHWMEYQIKEELKKYDIVDFLESLNNIPKNKYGTSGDGGIEYKEMDKIFEFFKNSKAVT